MFVAPVSPVSIEAGSSIAIEWTLKPDSMSVPNGLTLSFASSAGVSIGGRRLRLSVSKTPPRSM